MHHITVNNVIAPNFINFLLNDKALLSHVKTCMDCKDIVFTYALYKHYEASGFPEVSKDEKNKIRSAISSLQNEKDMTTCNFLWRRVFHVCHFEPETLAAADGQNADQQLLESSQQDGQLFFQAKCKNDDPHYWCAHLSIPVHPTKETILRIRVQNGKGERISKGIFHFCGLRLEIKDGFALLPLSDFQNHLNIPVVSIEFSEGLRQDGSPVLFEHDEN